MTIRKRSWTSPKGEQKVAWLVDYRDGAGTRRSKQFVRKRDAEAWQTQAAWEVAKGVHTADSQSITVAGAGEIWIKRAEADGLERTTIEGYRGILDSHIIPLIGSQRLSRLTMPMVRSYVDELLATRSRSTAARALRHLRMLLVEAQRRGLVAQNVAAGVKLGAATRQKGRVAIPSKAELQAMIATSDDDLRPFVITAIFTGLRASELRGLTWANIDLKKGVLSVTQRADRFNVIGPPKSASSRRAVPLAPAVVSELRAWKLRCPKGPLNLAFPAPEGGVLHYSHFMKRRFLPMQVRAGVCDERDGVPRARYSLHSLRHAAASAWIKQRIDLKRLQSWLGHASIEMTLNVYGHLIEDEAGDAILLASAQRELLG